MKSYLLPPMDRVRDWRDFRQTFTSDESDLEQLTKTLAYWKQYPVLTRYLDIDFPDTWPTPWELLNEGQFCEAGIGLMMHQTLILSDDRWTPDRVELIFVDNREECYQFMAVVVDQQYVLHYSVDSIQDLKTMKGVMIQNRYQMIDSLNYGIVRNENKQKS